MIPKGKKSLYQNAMNFSSLGNHMSSILQRCEDDCFVLKNFICSNRETPPENKELEIDFKIFLEKGISKIRRSGTKIFTEKLKR